MTLRTKLRQELSIRRITLQHSKAQSRTQPQLLMQCTKPQLKSLIRQKRALAKSNPCEARGAAHAIYVDGSSILC